MRAAQLSFALLPLLACAQSWCAPGGDWIFSFVSPQASGVTRAHYIGEEMVGGYTVQRIEQTIHAYQPSFPFGEAFTEQLPPLFTRVEGGIVYLWDTLSSTFDTLMWFSAGPGQHWTPAHWSGVDRFDVLDTGTTAVGDIPVHYVQVLFQGVADTLRERVGFDYLYLDPRYSLEEFHLTGSLRCYRDDLVSSFQGPFNGDPCDFSVAIGGTAPDAITLFPNPGELQFTLRSPSGPAAITVCDALGRNVLTERRVGGDVVVHTAALAPGTYLVRITAAFGSSSHMKWVKQ